MDQDISLHKIFSSVQDSQPISLRPVYIWSRVPGLKPSKLKIAVFDGFDIPTLTLFFLSFALVVALMKIFTTLGTRLGLGQQSEDIVMVPIR